MVELDIDQVSSKGEYNLKQSTEEFDYIVFLFQRDFYCTNCRNQVQDVEDRYEEFLDKNAQVVSILPENLSRAESWDEKYDLSYPVIADKNKSISDSFDQPVKFGPLGNLHDLIGRMPLTVIMDCSEDEVNIIHRKAGNNPADRPSVDDILQRIQDSK